MKTLLATLGLTLTLATPAAGATIADIGAWCWFADPRAVDYQGRAVFGWVADDGSIMVGDQNGVRYPLAPGFQRDDHDNPSFYIRRDGRLTAFWSAHAGPQVFYRTTTDATLTGWGPTRQVPLAAGMYTYPTPVRVGTKLYLFFSAGCSQGCGTAGATWTVSTDDGETWSTPGSLFDQTVAVRYIKYRAYGDTIHMAWNLGHPRTLASGIYHAVIRADGGIYRQDGTRVGTLGTPLSPTAGDRVYNPATAGGAWIHDLAVKEGRPFIVYATFPTLDNHVYRYARWNGRWYDEPVVAAGPSFHPGTLEMHYSGGISLNPGNPYVMYLSRKAGSLWLIERWIRDPDGWERQPIASGTSPNVRPYRVADGLAWMRGPYPSYTGFQTSLVWKPPDSAPAPPPAGVPPLAAPVEPVTVEKRPRWHGRCARLVRKWRGTHSRKVLRRFRRVCKRQIQLVRGPARIDPLERESANSPNG